MVEYLRFGRRSTGTANMASVVDSLAKLCAVDPEAGRPRPEPAQPPTRYAVLPNAGRPTFVVPLRPRAATASVVRSHWSTSSPHRRLAVSTLCWFGRLGGADLLPNRLAVRGGIGGTGPGSLREHLESAVGEAVSLGIHLGPPRANRKPILQLVTSTGRVLGFAKVGVDDLTCALVEAEASALRAIGVADLKLVEVPRIIHSGPWRDTQILVLTPVDTSNRGAPHSDSLQRAMLEVSRLGDISASALTRSPHWQGLRARLSRLSGPAAASLRDCARLLELAVDEPSVPFGSWHGDWTPWNMSMGRTGAIVWDWERFETGVPAGWDAIHYVFQSTVGRRADPSTAIRATLSKVDDLVGPFGVTPQAAPWVAAGYLLEIATRYLADRQQVNAQGDVADIGSWALPELKAICTGLAEP
jgi:hypothetical protein